MSSVDILNVWLLSKRMVSLEYAILFMKEIIGASLIGFTVMLTVESFVIFFSTAVTENWNWSVPLKFAVGW